MRTPPRSKRALQLLAATAAAMSITAALAGTAAPETTHEASQAAAIMTAVPSTLAADAVLAQITDADGALRFEVAEDGTRFVWADPSVFTARLAPYGAPFLTQGYIYPAGTLSARADGVNADGSPQFPEAVLGEWTCYGWYLGGGMNASSGTRILATQIYQFGDAWGAVTLVSDGYVPTTNGEAVDRAITGGTGPFTTVRGAVRETALGINETSGSNARFEIRLVTP